MVVFYYQFRILIKYVIKVLNLRLQHIAVDSKCAFLRDESIFFNQNKNKTVKTLPSYSFLKNKNVINRLC